ncbi:hypothetical protein [Nocardioides montaniterrae]
MNDHATYTEAEVAALPLGEAKADLLDAVLASDAAAPVSPLGRHRRTYRLVLAGAAAAAVAAVGISIAVNRPADVPVAQPGHPTSPSTNAQAAAHLRLVAMAQRMPRFLLDAPGWTITTVYGFGKSEGTLGFSRGTGADRQDLELNWYPGDQYDSYFHDRFDDPSIAHEDTQLLGDTVKLFTYSADDHATMLKPDGDSFVEMRGQGLSKADYLTLTAQLRKATVDEFLAALPADVTTPGSQSTRAQQVLADIPVPPGFSFKPDGETLDPYQFGALVTGQVTCAWIDVYRHGDAAAQQQAATALETSHHWKVLHDMDATGDWPEVIWEYADGIAKGDLRPQTEYDQGIGCTR